MALADASTVTASVRPDPNLRPVATGAWALYDVANTIWSFVIVSYAIGLWLTDAARFGDATGQLVFSLAVAVSVGLNAIVSPILGALSDRGGRRLPFLFAFTALCVVPTAVIGFSSPLVGVLLFGLANFAYQAALIYYDASLRLVSTPETRGRVSGIGVGIGYLGTVGSGLILFLFDIPVEGRFVLAATLYGLLAIPIFLVLRETPIPGAKPVTLRAVTGSWHQLAVTARHAREVPGLGRFLVGRFFYSDAVNTVIVVMSVVAVRAVGLTESQTALVLLSLTLVAIVMAFVWGALADRLGPKRTLMIVLASWTVGLILGAASLSLNGTDPATGEPIPGTVGVALFLLAGAILGSGLGGVQVSDRALMVHLAPAHRAGEFFGIYGLVGKASQVIGQLLYGAIVFLTFDALGIGAYQLAVLSLIVTMLIGAWLIAPIPDVGPDREHEHAAFIPPARLAPSGAPIEERD